MNSLKKKLGNQTYKFSSPITISNTCSRVGPTEGEGPLKNYFHYIESDDTLNQKTFEKAEHQFSIKTVKDLLEKSNIKKEDVDIYIAGDLLNQIITANATARDLVIPFWGIYNACASFCEGIQIASSMIDGGFFEKAIVTSTSHFSTAERQYRYPLELGTQSPPAAQRTVTGSGALLLSKEGSGPYITHMTIGKVMDYNQDDPNNMGSAMAIAACDTIYTHFEDTGYNLEDYDMILTGDLGKVGYNITVDYLKTQKNLDISNVYNDCGLLIYDLKKQNVMSGGSGAGCSASVFCSYIYSLLLEKKLNKILFCPTGALLSPVSTGQKESIPCIAHAVTIENNPTL